MFRIKALIFMIPLVLPIGQPPAEAADEPPAAAVTLSDSGVERTLTLVRVDDRDLIVTNVLLEQKP